MDHPHILLIHWHDVGRRLAAYGDSTVPSPNVDALAAEGLRFERAFCTAPLCSPARGSLFTGRYPHSNGLMGLAHLGWEYHPGERTLPMLLTDAGYRTTLVGLQHESADPWSLGFDEVVQLDAEEQYCGPVADLAAGYLSSLPADPGPLFLTVGMFEPHRPYPPERYEHDDPQRVSVPPFLPDNPDTRADLAAFHGAIRAADAATGKVLRALEAAGLADDTWVIFTTDHGMAFPRAKSTLYDPGIEVALVMRFPGRWGIRRSVCDRLVSHVDVLPTVLDRLGLPIPDGVQGMSFDPWLRGDPRQGRSEVFAEKNWHDVDQYDPVRCLRTDRFKYIRSYEDRPALLLPGDIEASLTRQGMGDEHPPRPPVELYDLRDDPWERRNLVDNPAHADTRVILAERLDGWRHDTADPLLDGPIDGPAGQGSRAGTPTR